MNQQLRLQKWGLITLKASINNLIYPNRNENPQLNVKHLDKQMESRSESSVILRAYTMKLISFDRRTRGPNKKRKRRRVDDDDDDDDKDVPWSKLLALGNCFFRPSQSVVLKTLFHQENRLFIITLFAGCDSFEVYLYDRSGFVGSCVEDIYENRRDFLRFAIGILFVEEKYLGFDTSMEEIDGRRYIYVNPSPSESPVKLEIKKTISRQNGTHSEGTTLWLAQGCLKDKDDINGTIEREFIVKDFWSVVIDGSKGRKISERLEETGYTSHIVSWECIGESTGMVRDGGYDESPSLPDNREHIRIVTSTIGELVDDLKTSEELLTTFLNLFLSKFTSI